MTKFSPNIMCSPHRVFLFTLALFILQVVIRVDGTKVDEYMEMRKNLIESDELRGLGASLTLDAREKEVNEILMELKEKEFREGVDANGDFFGATKHFFHSKHLIEASSIYQMIQLLPKGGAVHLHDVTIAQVDFVALNLSHWDNLYYCLNENEHLMFHFYPSNPRMVCNGNKNWTLVEDLRREKASSPGWVDNWFTQAMSMVTPTPETDYRTANEVWKHFENKISTTSSIALYEPAMKDYYWRILEEFYEDNVMYVEMRSLLVDIYRLNQSVLSAMEALELFKGVTEAFKASHPDFIGVKYIYAPHRFHSPEATAQLLAEGLAMQAKHPDFFAGFDLVGQEDIGTPLLGFLPQLLDAGSKGLKYFFHAGETAWHGTSIDENLFDAVLLNTTRIGHGYALFAHPLLVDLVQERGIGIEVCPISNQVLKLVDDLRNHPAISLLRDGFPIIISSDDPGIWGAKALSHDFYIAFMAMGGKRADLKFLKQLAVNSLEFSAMNAQEKLSAFARWKISWEKFLDTVIIKYGKNNSAVAKPPHHEKSEHNSQFCTKNETE